MIDEKSLVARLSIGQLVTEFQQAKSEVAEACRLFREAEEKLGFLFGQDAATAHGFDFDGMIRHHRADFREPETFFRSMRQSVWRRLIDKCELKKVCTVKRAKEIDDQLGDAKNLPEITEANVVAMLRANLDSLETTLVELIKEVFDGLRPMQGTHLARSLKTNKLWEVGERVILPWAVERRYNGKGFRMRHGYGGGQEALLRGLDNVMSILDGKGVVKSHYGPLYEAIDGCDRAELGETDYFEFRCFANGNLHLKFKRPDLLAELNRVGAGGAPRLKDNDERR